jgi:excisionase family DNA binding protein
MSDAELLALARALLRPLVAEAVEEELAARQVAAPAVEVLTVAEVARRCQVKPDTVLAWISRGVLKASRLPGTKAWRIRADDLEAALTGTGATPVDSPPASLADARARKLVDAVKKRGPRR